MVWQQNALRRLVLLSQCARRRRKVCSVLALPSAKHAKRCLLPHETQACWEHVTSQAGAVPVRAIAATR